MSDTISPTVERVTQSHYGIDAPEVGQRVNRRAYAVRDIWTDLRSRNRITEEEAEAGRRFARHYELAYRGRRVTPSYGTSWAEGTPVSQLAGTASEEEAARHVDYVRLHQAARDELPMSARQAIIYACDGRTLTWIGTMVAGYKSPDPASAAAVSMIKTGLEILVPHYTGRRRDPYP
jgi:hypothetical protein